MYQLRIKPAPAEQQTAAYVEGACHSGRADGRHASLHAIDATCPSIFAPRERVATLA